MRAALSLTEIGLAFVFISRSVTRLYERRAITLYGLAGARAAREPGTGAIPVWVSILSVTGWATAMAAGIGLLLTWR